MFDLIQLPNGDFIDFNRGIKFFLVNYSGNIHWRMMYLNIPDPTSTDITRSIKDDPTNRKFLYDQLLTLFINLGYTIK